MAQTTLQLREDQVADLAFMMGRERFLLLHDPGTGKTPPVCVYLYWLTTQGKKAAWVMPKSLLKKNLEELLAWTPLTEADATIIDGTPKQRAALIQKPTSKVLLMGFTRWSDDWKTILEYHPEIDAVVVDEFHLGYKGWNSKRTQALVQSMRHITRFGVMDGTLICGRLDSCYPAIHIVEPSWYFSYNDFLIQHEVTDFFGNRIGWTGHEKISRIFQQHGIRRTFEMVYGEQEIVYQKELVQMHPKQREAYDELEATALLELEDDFLEAAQPGVAAIRCRQIMAHPSRIIVNDKPLEVVSPKILTGKEERIQIHLSDHERTGDPLIIYGAFQLELERLHKLCEEMGLKAGMIHGGIPSKERFRIDEEFRAGKLQVVIGSPATCSVGWNWGHVDHIIFSSLDYEDANFDQAVRRAVRGVRQRPLRVTILEYENSIDQRIFQIIDTKSADAHKVDASRKALQLSET